MEGLSIEEKAKRYDRALEKLRSLHDNYDTISTLIDIKEELEHILPELKESEGERIRKALSAYFAKFKPNDMWDADFSFGDIVAWFEKQGKNNMGISEATKQEWSDYDECLLTNLIDDPNCSIDSEYVHWFKSLKDRYAWKPSDEQMEELHNVFNDTSAGWDDNVIESLYNDLKKLKG